MSCRSPARRISAPAARTTPRPGCRKAAARWPASAATTCRNSWTATPRPSPRWAARARRGSARRRLSRPTHVFANIGDGTYTHSGILAIRAAVAAGVNDDLQGAVQRRRRDDRRPAARRRPDRAAGRGAARRRGRAADRHRHRRAATNTRPAPSSRTARRCGTATNSITVQRELREIGRRHRDRLRPDLRRRKAPPPQARPLSRTRRSGSLSTIWFARAAAIARRPRTACRWCRSRPNSAASARSTSRAATRIFPASRASARALSRCMAAACASAAPADLGDGDDLPPLPEPALPALAEPYGILVTGVGGTGVVTIGALLGMAAHLEGKGVAVLDQLGMAQKGGAVMSHVRIAEQPGRRSTPCASPPAARACCSAATSSCRPAPRRCRRLHAGDDARDRQQPRDRSPAISPATPTCRFRAATCAPASSPRGRAGRGRVHRRDRARDRAARRFDRDQPVHARLCLSEGACAGLGGGDRAGDRTERRSRSISTAAPFAGAAAPRSIRPRSRRAPCRTTPCRRAIACRRRLDEIIARRVAFLTRIPERRLCRALRRPHPAPARGRGGACAGRHGADRGGRPRAVQADGLQGRIRGRPALYRDRFRGSASPSSSRAPTNCASISRRRCWPSAIPATGHLKKRVYGPWMLGAFRAAGAAAPAARHRVRHFRPHRRAPRRAPPDRRIRSRSRRDRARACRRKTMQPPSNWRGCRSRSAASATSRRRTCSAPRPGKPNCSPASARRRRPLSRPRSNDACGARLAAWLGLGF